MRSKSVARKSRNIMKPTERNSPERVNNDNLCKLLAEQSPQEFAHWLFGPEVGKVSLLKTELAREPIRADSVILLDESQEVCHAEFQTTMKSEIPIPLRMLD